MKLKDDKSGEKTVHKKNKNKHTSLPEDKNSTGDDMKLPEMKNRKKKSKDANAVVTEVGSFDGGFVTEEKKKKKKRKSDAESLNDAHGIDVNNRNEEFSKKKKKKLADDESSVETAEKSEQEEIEKKPKKKKKVKNKSVHLTPENVNLQKEEAEEQDMLQETERETKNNVSVEVAELVEKVKEKKKKKKKKASSEENMKSEDDTRVEKKKKKAKTEVSENGVELETLEEESTVVQEVKLKKKKKKTDGTKAESPQLKVDADSILESRDESTEGKTVVSEEGRRKQKKKEKIENNERISLEVSEIEDTEPKKEKRKKGEKREHPELKCEEVEEQSMETSKKKKKKKSSTKEETQDESSETSTKRKKVKKKENDEHESAQGGVVSLSKNSGNTDEVSINQETKMESQVEVEYMSPPQKPAKPTGFGQWSTAQFSSSEQQQKFLRLMGGFKKSFQASSESTGGAKMALGKDAQQQLQQGLLGEFERAQSRRLDFSNRGAGLGFTAPSNKKFSIDINASRSVRFDD